MKIGRCTLDTCPRHHSLRIWGQHKGADDPCKIVAAGALPAVSTNCCHSREDKAHVAQLDNAPDYGSGRWRFESFRARQPASQTAVLHQLPALKGSVTSFSKTTGACAPTEPNTCQAALLRNPSLSNKSHQRMAFGKRETLRRTMRQPEPTLQSAVTSP